MKKNEQTRSEIDSNIKEEKDSIDDINSGYLDQDQQTNENDEDSNLSDLDTSSDDDDSDISQSIEEKNHDEKQIVQVEPQNIEQDIQVTIQEEQNEDIQNQFNDKIDDVQSSDESDDQLSYDEDNPENNFPEYANDKNKELNQKILKTKKKNKKIDIKIEDYRERYQVMKDHFKNIQREIGNTQILLENKNKEIEEEKHLSLVLERKIGKFNKDQQQKEKLINDYREKLNDIQQKIFEGNQKLEKLKLEINWNEEEKEMWVLAAKQKQDDKTVIEKYQRIDNQKIKELTVDIKRLTNQKNQIEEQLEGEITETQALQIEINKISEEFSNYQIERKRLYEQWDNLIKKIANKNIQLMQCGEQIIKIKKEAKQKVKEVKNQKKEIKMIKRHSNIFQKDIQRFEKMIYEKKNENKLAENDLQNLKADMKITQNKLSAYTSKFEKQKKIITTLQNDLITKKKRLAVVENNFKKQEKILVQENYNDQNLRKISKSFDGTLKEKSKETNDLERKIQLKKQELYQIQKKLYKLKEDESLTVTEIGSITSSIKNLTTHSNKLFVEIQKQQELLYNAEYQIQLLERKVARAHGEKSVEETDYLVEKIKLAKQQHSRAQQRYIATSHATNQLQDEHRALEKRIKVLEEDKKIYVTKIEKVNLENDMTVQDLVQVKKQKEEVLVQNNIMKLEIKKIQNKVLHSHNKVLSLTNKKNQLDLTMTEKEQEIKVHHDLMKAEHKNRELERQKVASELAERKNKNKNLQIKYQSLIQSKQGDVNVHDHSQAYYVIKAAQEKEELERKQDELQAKINKADSELKALNNTLIHLKARNQKFREFHLNKNASKKDLKLKNALEDQFNEIGDVLIQKKKQLKILKEELSNNKNLLNETEQQLCILEQKHHEVQNENIDYNNIQYKNEQKQKRAFDAVKKSLQLLKKKKIENFADSNDYINYKNLLQENIHKTLNSILSLVKKENQQIFEDVIEIFTDNNIELDSKLSSIDLNSKCNLKRFQIIKIKQIWYKLTTFWLINLLEEKLNKLKIINNHILFQVIILVVFIMQNYLYYNHLFLSFFLIHSLIYLLLIQLLCLQLVLHYQVFYLRKLLFQNKVPYVNQQILMLLNMQLYVLNQDQFYYLQQQDYNYLYNQQDH